MLFLANRSKQATLLLGELRPFKLQQKIFKLPMWFSIPKHSGEGNIQMESELQQYSDKPNIYTSTVVHKHIEKILYIPPPRPSESPTNRTQVQSKIQL